MRPRLGGCSPLSSSPAPLKADKHKHAKETV
jgi:hypothetical protein